MNHNWRGRGQKREIHPQQRDLVWLCSVVTEGACIKTFKALLFFFQEGQDKLRASMHLTHPLVLVRVSPVQESAADSGAEGEVREEQGTWPKAANLGNTYMEGILEDQSQRSHR